MYQLDFQGIKLEQELYGGEIYEYYPLGKYVVAAPGVCGGRPTFKYTRLEISWILALIAGGKSIDYILDAYRESNISREGIKEALLLAGHTVESFVSVEALQQPIIAYANG